MYISCYQTMKIVIFIVIFCLFLLTLVIALYKRQDKHSKNDNKSKNNKSYPKSNKNFEKFKNLENLPEKCVRTPYSKEYAEKILRSLTSDINKVHPIGEYHLSFHPLECCTLEDSATEDKKKVFICVKDKKGRYYSYNKLLQVALHELSHAISKTVDPGHKSVEFLTNYNHLMNKASEMGIIDLTKLKV